MNTRAERFHHVVVLGASCASVLIGFLNMSALTHVLEPGSFGFYRAFLTSLQLLGLIGSCGLHYSYSRLYARHVGVLSRKRLHSSAVLLFAGLWVAMLCLVLVITVSSSAVGLAIPHYVVLAGFCLLAQFGQLFTLQKFQGEGRMVSYASATLAPHVVLAAYLSGTRITGGTLNIYHLIGVVVFGYGLVPVVSGIKSSLSCAGTKTMLSRVWSYNKTYGVQLYFGALAGVGGTLAIDVLAAGMTSLEQFAQYALAVSFGAPMALLPSTAGVVAFRRNVQGIVNVKDWLKVVSMTVVVSIVYVWILRETFHFFIGRGYASTLDHVNFLVAAFALTGLGDYWNRVASANGESTAIRNRAWFVGAIHVVSATILLTTVGIIGLSIARLLSSSVYAVTMLLVVLRILSEQRRQYCS